MTIPLEMPPYDDAHRSLWAAVDVVGERPTAEVVAVLRAAYDEVVVPHLAVGGLVTGLLAIRRGQDLSRARPESGLAWHAVPAAEPLEAVHAEGSLPPGVQAPAQHGGRVFKLDALWPVEVAKPGGVRGPRPLTAACSVVQGALAGGTADAAAQRAIADWVVATVARLDAATAFATVDFVGSFASDASPYEAAAKVIRTGVDPLVHVRGYQWLTVIGPRHVAALGGEAAVEAAPVAEVRPLPGGRYLLLLAEEANAVQHALGDLAAFLAPVLPPGSARVDAYRGPVPYRL